LYPDVDQSLVEVCGQVRWGRNWCCLFGEEVVIGHMATVCRRGQQNLINVLDGKKRNPYNPLYL
jgi:hypothetical protein